MTPRERFLNTLAGRSADRVPLELAGFQYASRAEVAKIANADRRALAERVFGQVHVPVNVPNGTNRMFMVPNERVRSTRETQPDGRVRTRGTIDTPHGTLTFESMYDPPSATGWQVKYPVETRADLDALRAVPWESPRPPARVAAPPLHPDLEGRAVHTTRISSPMVCVAGAMSYEWFLELAISEPDLIADLTEMCRVRTLDCLRAVLSGAAVDLVWMGGSEWVTPPMASPAIYDALVQEQERTIIAAIRAQSSAAVQVHCHGRVRHALERTIARGADYTEPVEPPPDGDITMAAAKALAAGRITLGGNIECRVLCNEDEDRTEAAVAAAFAGGKERFVLRPTEAPTPAYGPRESRNYRRLVDLWERLSPL